MFKSVSVFSTAALHWAVYVTGGQDGWMGVSKSSNGGSSLREDWTSVLVFTLDDFQEESFIRICSTNIWNEKDLVSFSGLTVESFEPMSLTQEPETPKPLSTPRIQSLGQRPEYVNFIYLKFSEIMTFENLQLYVL